MGLDPSPFCIRFANEISMTLFLQPLVRDFLFPLLFLYRGDDIVIACKAVVPPSSLLSNHFRQVAFVLDAFFVHYKKQDIEDVEIPEAPASKQLQIDYENAFSLVCDICHFPSVFYHAASHAFLCSCCFEHSKSSDGVLHKHQARSILKIIRQLETFS
jgi:hypothetical protein